MGRRHFVLGIDGMPYTYFKYLIDKGIFIHLKKYTEKVSCHSMNSTMPPVSSVAWSSYATGKNPDEHEIYGFTERNKLTDQIYIPTARDRKTIAIWEELSKLGKRVAVLNVPLTYPPTSVNGIMVSCFLTPSIVNATYPKSYYKNLIKMNYTIDVDAPRTYQDKDQFLTRLSEAIRARVNVTLEIIKQEKWDYLHLHIMETDRLFHFFWDSIEKGEGDYFFRRIEELLREMDKLIGLIFKELEENYDYTILSDHGFCNIVHEVDLNAWLIKEGYYNKNTLFSFTPGRIYILEEEHKKLELMEEIRDKLLNLRDESQIKIIRDVFFKRTIYPNASLNSGPDLIVHPQNGYDLKSSMQQDKLFYNSMLTGMHTYENAMIATTLSNTKINHISEVRKYIMESICYDNF